MRFVLLCTCCFIAVPAFAQRMPDYSIPPSEITQSSGGTTNQGGIGGIGQQLPGQAPARGAAGHIQNASQTPPTPSNSYMTGYCDKNFQAGVANPNPALTQCLQQQKEQSCAIFSRLPGEVKTALDTAIICTSYALSGEDTSGVDLSACDKTDSARLQLIKKYWQDPDTTRALVFLPEDVLDTSGTCLRGRK